MKSKTIYKAIGFSCLVSYAANMIRVFYTAYFNNYRVIVTVNDYGEAVFEFWFVLLSIPFIVYLLKDVLAHWGEE